MAPAAKMNAPVVMKISGPKILHKTDVGGVSSTCATKPRSARLRGHDRSDQAKMGKDIEICGVLIQKRLPKGKETILGMTRTSALER